MPMSDEEPESVVRTVERRDREPMHGLGFTDPETWLSVQTVGAIAWAVAAGSYGYYVGQYGPQAESVPMDDVWVFIVFGLAVGVAASATVVVMLDGDDE